jgi:hypothetical protein
MVLYNGNAEVVGNFRALNFYKSSDINIKEDIRLLEEGTYQGVGVEHEATFALSIIMRGTELTRVTFLFRQGLSRHSSSNRWSQLQVQERSASRHEQTICRVHCTTSGECCS